MADLDEREATTPADVDAVPEPTAADARPDGTAASTRAERFPPTRLLVVPRSPGPLIEIGRSPRPEDELDELIDDMFGEATTEGPGPFDLLLLALGAAAVGWAVLTGAGGLWVALGIVLVLLGLALPVRSVLRAYRARAAGRARRAAATQGYVLDTTAPATRALVVAYRRLIGIASRSRSQFAADAVRAGHGAMVEVATLLDGGPPVTDAQIAYIEKRTEAMRGTASGFERARPVAMDPTVATGVADLDEAARQRQRADLVTRAREELESTAGMSSLDQLDTVRDLLGREARDDRA